jgi:hypothetical protein
VATAVKFMYAGAVTSLIGAGLWLWMARGSRAGKGWARTVSTVLFVIATISIIASVASAGHRAFGAATKLYELVGWLIGLVAIVLLWRRASADYFRSVG